MSFQFVGEDDCSKPGKKDGKSKTKKSSIITKSSILDVAAVLDPPLLHPRYLTGF